MTLVSRNPSTPTRYRIVVEKTASVGELKDALEALSGVAANSLTFADVYMSKIHRRYEDYESVSTITSRDDIYAYEVLPPAQPSKKKQRVTDSDDEHEQNAAADDVADEDVASTDGVPATSPAHSHDGEMPDADEDVAAAAAALALGPSSDTNNNNSDNNNDSDNDNDGNDGNFYLALQRKPESTAYSFVGLPQILSFEHTPTYAELITSVYQCIKPFLGPPRAARPDRPPPPVPSTAEAPANDDNNDGDEGAPADTTAENDSDETALNQAMNGGASAMHTDDDDDDNNNNNSSSSSNTPPTNNANVIEADNTTPDNTTTATATATTATTDEPDATPEPDETETGDNEQKTVDTEPEEEDTTWSEGLSEEVVAAARDIQLWVSISAYREAQLRASCGPVNLDSRTTVTLVLVGALADRFNRESEDARVDDASFSAESDTAVELPTLDDCLGMFVCLFLLLLLLFI